ncbi:MAG: hypothetical protein WA821_21720 [Anaerolineales bacterium]
MKPIAQMAVMNVDKGEEIVGGWATPHIPQVGIYKLLAKKKKNNTIEWAHFVQRDNGLREQVYRGEVKNQGELDTVLEVMNKNLLKFFGVAMQPAEYDISTLDGKKPPTAIH